MSSSSTTITPWHYNDLKSGGFAPAGRLPAADDPSPLAGYVTSNNNQQHVIFNGIVGNNIVTQEVHVFELYYDGAWHHNDLTQPAGAPPVNRNQNRFGLDGYVTLLQQPAARELHRKRPPRPRALLTTAPGTTTTLPPRHKEPRFDHQARGKIPQLTTALNTNSLPQTCSRNPVCGTASPSFSVSCNKPDRCPTALPMAGGEPEG